MNRADSQKLQEKAFLEKFRGVYRGFPDGEIISAEAPDFIVQNDGTCIGIEVTEFSGQSSSSKPSRAKESRILRALKRVEEACRANGLSNFQVNVNFHPGRRLEPTREASFVDKLVQLIQRNLPDTGNKTHLSATPESRELPPEEVISIWLHRPLDFSEQSYVAPSWGGVSPKYTLHELQEETNRKKGKVRSYKPRCPEVWLLIVGGQIQPSTWMDLPDGIDKHRFQSPFDKVFFLHLYREQVTEFLLERKQ